MRDIGLQDPLTLPLSPEGERTPESIPAKIQASFSPWGYGIQTSWKGKAFQDDIHPKSCPLAEHLEVCRSVVPAKAGTQ